MTELRSTDYGYDLNSSAESISPQMSGRCFLAFDRVSSSYWKIERLRHVLRLVFDEASESDAIQEVTLEGAIHAAYRTLTCYNNLSRIQDVVKSKPVTLEKALRFINHITPHTSVTNHQIPWIDPPLDLLQPVVIRSPKGFFPMRLIRVGLVYVCATFMTDDLLKLQANIDEILLALLLLRIGSVVGPVDAITHNGAGGCPDGVY